MNYQAVMFVACALIFSLGALFGMHTYLLLTNQSTLEMDALYSSNPFARKIKVLKTQKERQQRNPIQLFAARGANPRVVQNQNRQMKEVTSFVGNLRDVLGEDQRYWFCPVTASDRTCDGFDWQISPLH
jgi:hypothetical protein